MMMIDATQPDQPKPVCIDAANNISELLRLCVNTYGLKRVGFMYTHCVVTAAMIHLLNVSEKSKEMALSEAYLCQAIRALYEMKTSFPIVERYLRNIRSLTMEWFPHGAPQVRIPWSLITILTIFAKPRKSHNSWIIDRHLSKQLRRNES
jgi:hypothetical protein